MIMAKEDSHLFFDVEKNQETENYKNYHDSFEFQYNQLNTIAKQIDNTIDQLHDASPDMLYNLFSQSINDIEELSRLLEKILENAIHIFCSEYMSKQTDGDKLKIIKLEVLYTTKFEGLSSKIKEIIRFENKNKKQMSRRETMSYLNYIGPRNDSIAVITYNNNNNSFNSIGDNAGSFSTDSLKNEAIKQIDELKQLDTCIAYHISKILELINQSQHEYYISGPPSEGQSNRRSMGENSMRKIAIFVTVMFIICILGLGAFVYFCWND